LGGWRESQNSQKVLFMSKEKVDSRSDLLWVLKANLPYLREKYQVSYLSIFGSVARNQHHRHSDVDILVAFYKVPSLFTLIRIENFLYEQLGRRVDLVMEDSIKPAFRQRISKDIIQVRE
jgi:predicted nucleotidyltransferase